MKIDKKASKANNTCADRTQVISSWHVDLLALWKEFINTEHVQVNIDFEDEQDMIEKMRVGIALQPIATALFSNSPFRDGKDTGTPSNPILLQMSRIYLPHRD